MPGRTQLRRRLGLSLAALLFLAGGVAVIPAETPSSQDGRFQAKRDGDRVWLQLRFGSKQRFGNSLPVRAFRQVGDDRVELRREAGALLFSGLDLKNPKDQEGTFAFQADNRYVEAMAERGYRDLPGDRLFELAYLDVTLAFVDGLVELGYREPLDRVVEMRIHGVDASYIRELAAEGYGDSPAQRLVELRIHGIDGSYIRDLAAVGYADLPVQRLLEMRIHGVDGRFVTEMRDAGYGDLPARTLAEMRIHGVDPSWVRDLATLGYDRLPAQRLVEMRIHGVNPSWIQEIQALGYGRDAVTVRQLVEMRIHGVEPDWIRSLGETGLSARRLIEKRIHDS